MSGATQPKHLERRRWFGETRLLIPRHQSAMNALHASSRVQRRQQIIPAAPFARRRTMTRIASIIPAFGYGLRD
jgi:hypothetical protein